jgi:hypothetical protein
MQHLQHSLSLQHSQWWQHSRFNHKLLPSQW